MSYGELTLPQCGRASISKTDNSSKVTFLPTRALGGFEKFSEWGLVRPLAQVKSEE